MWNRPLRTEETFHQHCRLREETDERLETSMACHEAAFAFIGGTPHEVLYDNMRTVVIGRNAYGPGKHRV